MARVSDVTSVDHPSSDTWFRRFARWFDPYGILIAVCALIVAFATLWTEFDLRNRTLAAMQEERDLRDKTLTAMEEEAYLRDKMLIALKEEKELRDRILVAWGEERILREASLVGMLADRLEVAADKNTPYAGHVPILERLVHMRVNSRALEALETSGVRFDVDGGVNLIGADLSHVDFGSSVFDHADFSNAKLSGTNFDKAQLARAVFKNANLTQANLKEADLTYADFTAAKLHRTVLKDADVSNAEFRGAIGLTQRQLSTACADFGSDPSNLPKDNSTGKRLVWEHRSCPQQ